MQRTTIYLSDELHADLRRLAWKIGCTMTDLIRHAVSDYAREFALARRNDSQEVARLPRELKALNQALYEERSGRDRRSRGNSDCGDEITLIGPGDEPGDEICRIRPGTT